MYMLWLRNGLFATACHCCTYETEQRQNFVIFLFVYMYMINDIFGEKWKRDVIIVYTSSPPRSTFKYTVYHIKYKGSDAYFEHIKKKVELD